MAPRERIRRALLGLPTDHIPLHCRTRMAPLAPEYQWVRDLGWGVVGSHRMPHFSLPPVVAHDHCRLVPICQ